MGRLEAVDRLQIQDSRVACVSAGGESLRADYYVLALPFEKIQAVAPELEIEPARFEHSPITGIHLWFDRPVTNLPHATLLDRTIQWMFHKSALITARTMVRSQERTLSVGMSPAAALTTSPGPAPGRRR